LCPWREKQPLEQSGGCFFLIRTFIPGGVLANNKAVSRWDFLRGIGVVRIMRIIIIYGECMKLHFAFAGLALLALGAQAGTDEFTLTIQNHAFSQREIKIPAGKKVKLLVENKDASPAEFESKALGREKVITGKSTGVINLGPLKPGRYAFVEEYHETEAGAQGTIVVE
jgi:hypothetical protein